MRKFFLFILSLLITSSLYSQIINFPDANFKAKLLESDSSVGIAYGDGGSFKIDANDNGEIEVSEVLLVGHLNIRNSNISDLTGIEYFTNLYELRCEDNSLTALDVSMIPNMRTLGVYNNDLTYLNITGLSNLRNLYASRNLLSSIDLTELPNLLVLDIDNNELSILDFSNTPNIHSIRCFNNQLTTLDLSPILRSFSIDCSSNQLETLNIKNGFPEHTLNFSDNENLQYICADDSEVMTIENKINEYGYTNCYTNSLCSFVQGENFYTVSGHVKYDVDGNGCDISDIDYPELLFSFSNGTNLGTAFANTSGNYAYSLQAGMYTFTPSLENTTYFSITPENISVNFPEDANSITQDFCVSANGDYPDLKITMTGESSGYDTFVSYKITYTNEGTMTQSGNVSLTYGDDLAVFSSSVPVISHQNGNELIWSFSDLKPFESREIEFIMDLSAVDSNGEGILLNYVTSINSNLTETTPSDNIFELNQLFFCCLLNTNEFIFSDYFSQYPNPTNQYLNIELKKQIDVKSILIYNLLGQPVKKIPFEGKQHIKINVSNFKTGHYFIKILTPEKVFNTKFIKN